MKNLPKAALFLLGLAGFAFGGSTSYFAIAHVRKGKDFHFSILEVRRHSGVETKINQLLQLSELRALADRKRHDVFEQAAINDGTIYGRKTSLFYRIFTNNPRTLSVRFDNSTDGATTHWWSSYYNFNAQNGDLISLRDLFSDTGFEKFVELVAKRRTNAYRLEVARKVEPDERESFLGEILWAIKNDDLSDFSIGSRSITIDGGNLLGKSLCCENLNMKVGFDLSAFRPWLNEYGRLIFGLRSGNLARFRSNRLPQLFTGSVDGKFPFVAVLNVDGGFRGVYAYLKYRKGIFLTGSLDDNHVQLTEHVLVETEMSFDTDSNHRFIDGGSISGVFDSSILRGVWTDKTKGQSLPFLAYRK